MAESYCDCNHNSEFETIKSIYPDEFEVISIYSPNNSKSEGLFRTRLQLDSPITLSYSISGNYVICNTLAGYL